MHCLIAGLHSLGDDVLPIMTSDFYSKHMQAAKPEGGPVQLPRRRSEGAHMLGVDKSQTAIVCRFCAGC